MGPEEGVLPEEEDAEEEEGIMPAEETPTSGERPTIGGGGQQVGSVVVTPARDTGAENTKGKVGTGEAGDGGRAEVEGAGLTVREEGHRGHDNGENVGVVPSRGLSCSRKERATKKGQGEGERTLYPEEQGAGGKKSTSRPLEALSALSALGAGAAYGLHATWAHPTSEHGTRHRTWIHLGRALAPAGAPKREAGCCQLLLCAPLCACAYRRRVYQTPWKPNT